MATKGKSSKSAKSTKSSKATKTTKSVSKKVTTKKAPATTKATVSSSNWSTLLTVSLAVFLAAVTATILTTSTGSVLSAVKSTSSGVQGAIAMYAVTTAAFLILGAKLGAMWGRKNTFLFGVVLFAAGAVTASYASNLSMLVLGLSVIQGLGSALIIPQASAIVSASAKDQPMSHGLLGAAVVSGLVTGPVAGALITDSMEWFWAPRFVVVGAILVLILGFMLKGDAGKKEKIDLGPVWLSAMGMVLVAVGCLMSLKYGLIHPRQALVMGDVEFTPFGFSFTIFSIGLGLAALYGTVLKNKFNEAKKLPTLFKPSVLASKKVKYGLLAVAAQTAVVTGLVIGLGLFVQVSMNLDLKDTAIAFAPLAASVVVVSLLTAVIGTKIAPKQIVGTGFLMSVLGLVLLDTIIQPELKSSQMIPGLIVFGVGAGLLVSQAQNFVASLVDKKDTGDASNLGNLAQQAGIALGAVVFGAFVLTGLTHGFGNSLVNQDLYDEQSQELLSGTVETDVRNMNDNELNTLLSSVPPEVTKQINDIKVEAEFNTIKTALGLMALTSLVGFVATVKSSKK